MEELAIVIYDVSMKKLGFDMQAHRDALDKVVQQQTADEANRIARESNTIAEKSLKSNHLMSVLALTVSIISATISIVALFVK